MPSVLVVDDDPSIRALVCDILMLEEYEVRAAADGLHALAAIAAEIPDVVILDFMMPRMNGSETLQHIRNNPATEALPVVMLTAAADDERAWQAWQDGVDYFLTKPFEPEKLLEYLAYLFTPQGQAAAPEHVYAL